ncbi:MFS transporter [Arthrobacter sp. Rue61a]|jgi:DHA3 family multidrug efflux protein-like MFS transporter|uniref:Major facilitator superfamily (MFS) transporter n=1 Tax=Paenarthrobacter aurescens (strain TC1) TaxID=290340 RepID=A1RBK9_PAEAT|nr:MULTISPECIES: MFS transporter [Micrococcaceae]ABM07842.1 putative major facilitator superfamily (MFS) transporter [Paenarthrobacter aurescens TC1]AFR30959.1 putative major facilitator superfamily (MFS) transporter [Arthrobacter sp. Rue61a]
MTEQEPAPAASTDTIDLSQRTPAQRSRTFTGILVNTALANITTSYLWYALTFWVYLETRNVIATGVIGGAYMLLIALSSISFGTLVDRYRKLAVMRFAAIFTLVMFVLSGIMFLLTPEQALLDLTQPWFWIFTMIILIGAVVENMRNIALSTTVTILVEPDRRANANGLVGMVQGLTFIVTSVLSGLSVGLLGMGWTVVVALVLTALAFLHLLTLRLPEEVRAAASDAQGGFDLRGSWAAVMAISGLFALILFSTFNNFIGGVYMALMDPYGLEMFSVEIWGTVFAVGATGFIVGGALIGKFGLGSNPLRTMLIAVALMGLLGAVFTLREWAWLYIVGIWLYLALVPVVEAAEQTVIQKVVPLPRQGRVFGFAMAFESAAAPITAFLIAPIAQFWIIPYARSTEGAAQLEPLLGEGISRGIALVFLVAGLIMIVVALIAFLTPVYRRVSASYAQAGAEETESEGAESPSH